MTTKHPGGRIPIGREREPDPPPYLWFPRDMLVSPSVDRLLPQAATIDGTVLRAGARRCDLATAGAARVRTVNGVMAWTGRGAHDSALFEAWQDQTGPPVSLVITVAGGSLFRAEHLRLLAGILADRAWQPGRTDRRARQAVTFLSELAERLDRRNQPVDWSFRAGPMADRRRSSGEYI